MTLANSRRNYLSSAENRVKENPLRSLGSCWGSEGKGEGRLGKEEGRRAVNGSLGLRQDD